MPALPSVVTSYLATIRNNLTDGTDLGSNLRGAAQNYLRAQDMATVLDLLQTHGFSQSSNLTPVSGTVRSVTDGAATFVANTQIGNTVVFTGGALVGEERKVVSNTTTTLTFEGADLPSAPIAANTYTIRGTMFQEFIDDLRENQTLADAPRGNVYGDNRVTLAAIRKGVESLGGTITERNVGRPGLTALAASTDTIVYLSEAGVDYRIDQLRGTRLAVAGIGSGIVLRNTENTATLRAAMPSAPVGGEAVTITVPVDDFGGTSSPKIITHAGSQPGENAFLADILRQLENLVVAFVLPT